MKGVAFTVTHTLSQITILVALLLLLLLLLLLFMQLALCEMMKLPAISCVMKLYDLANEFTAELDRSSLNLRRPNLAALCIFSALPLQDSDTSENYLKKLI